MYVCSRCVAVEALNRGQGVVSGVGDGTACRGGRWGSVWWVMLVGRDIDLYGEDDGCGRNWVGWCGSHVKGKWMLTMFSAQQFSVEIECVSVYFERAVNIVAQVLSPEAQGLLLPTITSLSVINWEIPPADSSSTPNPPFRPTSRCYPAQANTTSPIYTSHLPSVATIDPQMSQEPPKCSHPWGISIVPQQMPHGSPDARAASTPTSPRKQQKPSSGSSAFGSAGLDHLPRFAATCCGFPHLSCVTPAPLPGQPIPGDVRRHCKCLVRICSIHNTGRNGGQRDLECI